MATTKVQTTIIARESLRQIIRSAIEVKVDEPDAKLIAAEIWDAVPDEIMTEVAELALCAVIKDEQRKMRQEAMQKAEVDARARQYAETGKTSAERAAEASEEDEKARKISAKKKLEDAKSKQAERTANKFFNVWLNTPTGNKFLGDCTADDFRFSRDNKRDQSEALLTSAARDEKFARHLDESVFETLREMGYNEAIKALVD